MQALKMPGVTLAGAGAYLYESCRDEEVLLVGPAGSSKTIGAMKKLLWACYAYPGSLHLLCRQTRKSLTDTTLPTFESIIGEAHPEVLRVGRENRHSYKLNGSEVVCAGLDEPSKAFGSAWGLVVLEEAIEAELGAWELFGRAARDPRLRKKGQSNKFPYHQYIAVTNPGPPEHWLNKRASEHDEKLVYVDSYDDYYRVDQYNSGKQSGLMRRLLAVHQDNPTLFDLDKWEWSEEGQTYLARLDRMSGHRRSWMRYGLWRQPAGAVFPEWDSGIHVVDDFEPPPTWPVVLAYDPGFATTACVWLVGTPDGGIVAFDEIYEGKKSLEQHCEEMNRRNENRNVMRMFADPNAAWSGNAGTGMTLAAQARMYGVNFTRWPRDAGPAFDAGVEAIRSCLNHAATNKPTYLKVCRKCRGLQSNFSTWSYKKDRTGEVPEGAAKYEERFDHSIDCVRGAIQSQFLQRTWLQQNADDI